MNEEWERFHAYGYPCLDTFPSGHHTQCCAFIYCFSLIRVRTHLEMMTELWSEGEWATRMGGVVWLLSSGLSAEEWTMGMDWIQSCMSQGNRPYALFFIPNAGMSILPLYYGLASFGYRRPDVTIGILFYSHSKSDETFLRETWYDYFLPSSSGFPFFQEDAQETTAVMAASSRRVQFLSPRSVHWRYLSSILPRMPDKGVRAFLPIVVGDIYFIKTSFVRNHLLPLFWKHCHRFNCKDSRDKVWIMTVEWLFPSIISSWAEKYGNNTYLHQCTGVNLYPDFMFEHAFERLPSVYAFLYLSSRYLCILPQRNKKGKKGQNNKK